MKRRSILVIAPALAFGARAMAQQDWPTKPVRLAVPFGPGTPADVAGRLMAEKWAAAWGQPVVVDNVPGAAGTIGVARVAKSASDGYTLVFSGDAAAATNVALMPNLGYDTRKDLTPIMQVGSTPNLLVVRKDLPANNVQELIALARKQPGKLTYGSTGIGTSQHFCGEILCKMADIDMVHVPYKEPYTNDLIAGRIDMGFANTVTTLQHVRAGTVRALAVSSLHRIAMAPDVPTVAEQGLPGFNVTPWFGLLAPAGTPVAIVNRVHTEAARAIADPAVKLKLEERGFELIASTPKQFAELLNTEIPRLAELIKARGIKLQ